MRRPSTDWKDDAWANHAKHFSPHCTGSACKGPGDQGHQPRPVAWLPIGVAGSDQPKWAESTCGHRMQVSRGPRPSPTRLATVHDLGRGNGRFRHIVQRNSQRAECLRFSSEWRSGNSVQDQFAAACTGSGYASQAFGADFVLSLPGCSRRDIQIPTRITFKTALRRILVLRNPASAPAAASVVGARDSHPSDTPAI